MVPGAQESRHRSESRRGRCARMHRAATASQPSPHRAAEEHKAYASQFIITRIPTLETLNGTAVRALLRSDARRASRHSRRYCRIRGATPSCTTCRSCRSDTMSAPRPAYATTPGGPSSATVRASMHLVFWGSCGMPCRVRRAWTKQGRRTGDQAQRETRLYVPATAKNFDAATEISTDQPCEFSSSTLYLHRSVCLQRRRKSHCAS